VLRVPAAAAAAAVSITAAAAAAPVTAITTVEGVAVGRIYPSLFMVFVCWPPLDRPAAGSPELVEHPAETILVQPQRMRGAHQAPQKFPRPLTIYLRHGAIDASARGGRLAARRSAELRGVVARQADEAAEQRRACRSGRSAIRSIREARYPSTCSLPRQLIVHGEISNGSAVVPVYFAIADAVHYFLEAAGAVVRCRS